MPVQFLSEADHERLNRFPEEVANEDLFDFFFLSEADHNEVAKQRSDSNRLGFALQLCTLRYLGFIPNDLPSIPPLIVKYVADQIEVSADEMKCYGERTRREHQKPIQAHLGFRRATELDMLCLECWLLERALEHDRPTLLFELVCDHLKQHKIVRIGSTRLAQMVSTARMQAQEVTYQKLQPLLTEVRRVFLDRLLEVDQTLGRTSLYWLQQTPTANTTGQILETLSKIAFLQEQSVTDWDLSGLNPNRVKFLANLGKRASNQYLQRASEQRRYPILVAFLKQSLYNLTDDLIEMFDQHLWELYSEARREFEKGRLQATKSINQKLRTLRDIGQVLLDPDVDDQTVRTVAFEHISPEQLHIVLGETEQMIRPEKDAYVDYFGKFYNRIRRFSGKLLSTLCFQAKGDGQGLIQALELVQDIHAGKRRKLPTDALTDFVPDTWRPYVFEASGLNRYYYELAALWVLRQGLRTGEVYVSHSQRFIELESYFIPTNEWSQLRSEALQLTGTPQEAKIRFDERERELICLIEQVETLLNHQGDLREEEGKLVLTPFEAEDHSVRVKRLEEAITARLPELEITDVLIEVDTLTGFSDHFEHLNSSQGRNKDLLLHLYACLLGQSCNMGLWQMAHSTNLTYQHLSWCNTWYIRDETLREATKSLVNYHYHLPLSHLWGGGILSSSDGQRFPVKGKIRQARALPRYFGYGKGITFYTWTSDQFSQYGSKAIPSTTRDATYVLDEILNNETELAIEEHTTDTAGYTELIFALFDLLGLRFSPRIRDLADQRLYRTSSISLKAYPNLREHLQGVIKKERILAYWDEMLRLAGSLKLGWVTASLIVQKLQAFPQQHPLTQALQEYGRLIKTLHILRWYEDVHTRRRVSRQINKGEAIHSLRTHLCYANQGKIKGQPDEQLGHQVGCLNLVTNVIILWNTIYMNQAVEQLKREGYSVDNEELKHIWPTRFEHINIYGRYQFNLDDIGQKRELRNLRQPATCFP